MIDKYKQQRVQRIPKWHEVRPAQIVSWAVVREAARSILMQQPPAQDALISGALPHDLDPLELRSESE